ncbi:unnamed protein product [Echinostoma caproni]|uniref:DHC_N1 domain-containing protein n=1 Tax=Echinostoma caproni TaxID=27848 RepID=A0A183AQ37_9TREM|nr:unnamed protein product [Echinostoma caproni]
MNEIRRHQTDTAQHLSFLDHHRDTIVALTSDGGSGPQYTQQAHIRILDTFVKPIWSMIEQAKALWNVLQDYETWLTHEGRDHMVRTTWLTPITRVSIMTSKVLWLYRSLRRIALS